jgi:hypothetical protein
MKWALARLKLIAAGVVMAATGALIEGFEQQFALAFGFTIPADVKLYVITFVGGIVANFTDNVKLNSDGTADVAATLPKVEAPAPATPAA